MPRPRSSPFDGGPSPPVPWTLSFIVLLIGACGGDSPTEPPPVSPPVSADQAAGKRSKDSAKDHGVLSIQDMLGDPLFLASVDGVEAPVLSDQLADIVDALASGQTTKASNMIARAEEEVESLEDDADNFESVFYWSVIERFFEAAEVV